MIALEDIAITFNKGTALEMPALRGVNLNIPNGQFVTVIGSNGAGKSTLLNILAGQLRPDAGHVSVDGKDVTAWPTHRRAPIIARLFQDPRSGICEHMSILENIAIASARTTGRGLRLAVNNDLRRRATERLSMLSLGLERRLDDSVSTLSGGQRQALSLIMATFGASNVLLLDEHTAALDPGAAHLIMSLTDDIVRRFGITTLMVTHSMRQALEYGSRIIMLHQGRIMLDFSGPARSSMTAEKLIALFQRGESGEISDDALLLN